VVKKVGKVVKKVAKGVVKVVKKVGKVIVKVIKKFLTFIGLRDKINAKNLIDSLKTALENMQAARLGALARIEKVFASAYRTSMANVDQALCKCGWKFKEFDDRLCYAELDLKVKAATRNGKVDQKKLRRLVSQGKANECYGLYLQLSSASPECVCPVDGSQGGCGVPLSVKLDGKGKSGFQVIPSSSAKMRRRLLTMGNDKVTSSGLTGAVKSWVESSVKNYAKLSPDGVIVWEDRIPQAHGVFFSKTCDSLKWSVTKTIGGQVYKVDFAGLSYCAEDACREGGRRRRLLNRGTRSGC
jgi:hypothetical protein